MLQAAARARSELAGPLSRRIDDLAAAVVGREQSLFAPDLAHFDGALRTNVTERRLLVVGGAGTIGSATLRTLLRYQPAQLDVVDVNENQLAELIRDIRSSDAAVQATAITTLPLDLGSPLLERWLQTQPAYDAVLNFAAVKHVRSEKNVVSVLQMLDVNVLRAVRLLDTLHHVGFEGRYFSVSTDKAADPVNLMGASKRLMELALFELHPPGVSTTSARFANVAFSNGSLLESFLLRIEKRQPISVPRDARRFFVTPKEAGELCAIAALAIPEQRILIPALTERHLTLLTDVAELVVQAYGFRPIEYDNIALACRAFPDEIAAGRYPMVCTPLDTAGEKEREVFVGRKESVERIGARQLSAVIPARASRDAVMRVLHDIHEIVHQPSRALDKPEVVRLLQSVIPELHHRETGHNLDERA